MILGLKLGSCKQLSLGLSGPFPLFLFVLLQFFFHIQHLCILGRCEHDCVNKEHSPPLLVNPQTQLEAPSSPTEPPPPPPPGPPFSLRSFSASKPKGEFRSLAIWQSPGGMSSFRTDPSLAPLMVAFIATQTQQHPPVP